MACSSNFTWFFDDDFLLLYHRLKPSEQWIALSNFKQKRNNRTLQHFQSDNPNIETEVRDWKKPSDK